MNVLLPSLVEGAALGLQFCCPKKTDFSHTDRMNCVSDSSFLAFNLRELGTRFSQCAVFEVLRLSLTVVLFHPCLLLLLLDHILLGVGLRLGSILVTGVKLVWNKCMVHACALSHVQLFATPWTVARQAPLSLGFHRQGYWSRLSFPSLGEYWNIPDPGI